MNEELASTRRERTKILELTSVNRDPLVNKGVVVRVKKIARREKEC